MASEQTIILTRNEYEAPLERNSELEDRLAALEADDGVCPPRCCTCHHQRQGAYRRLSEPSGHHIAGVVETDKTCCRLPFRD